MPVKSKELALKIARILQEKKALDVSVLDIHSLTVITDYFIIASGGSESQVQALCEEVEVKMNEQGYEVKRRDGQQENRWIVMDYGDVILHIFHHEERKFYDLERLWVEGNQLSVDNT